MTESLKKTILIIDDDDILREVMEKMLVRLGYSVLKASSGDAAIQLGKSSEIDIDIAILDMFLPDVRGDKLCPKIQENHPKMKIILMSGYGLQDIDVLKVNASGFIQKPCTYKALEETLNKIV